MNPLAESQHSEDASRQLTDEELRFFAELDALGSPAEGEPAAEVLSDPVPAQAPTPPAFRFAEAISQAKARRYEHYLEERRREKRLAYAQMVWEKEGRRVQPHLPLTPEQRKEKEREKERAKYHAGDKSTESEKRAARRRRQKERERSGIEPAKPDLPENFGKFGNS